jgi:hypothetical protein
MITKEFMNDAIEMLDGMIPKDLRVTLSQATVTKMNDQQLHGIVFKQEGVEAAPTIYVDSLYERYEDGEPMRQLMGETFQVYLDSLIEHPEIVQPDLSYEAIRDNVTLRLVELKRNRMYLVDVPYMSVGNGMAMVCDIKINQNEEGFWRTTITRDMLEKQGYDKKELFENAMKDAWEHEPPVLMDMNSQLFGFFDRRNLLDDGVTIGEDEKSRMYVLSNKDSVLGASTIFYPGMQERIAEKLGEGYYVLPSSIHEVLIVPDSADISLPMLSAMVRDANRHVVDAKDVLSDNVFHFDKDEKMLSTRSEVISMQGRSQEARC